MATYTNVADFILKQLLGFQTMNLLNQNIKFLKDNVIPATTSMLFFQAAAPTGWTKITTQNDKYIRVVSGTGGGSGGTVAASAGITSVVPGHGHKLRAATTGLSTGALDNSLGSAGSFGTTAGGTTQWTDGASGTGGVDGSSSFNCATINPAYIDCIVCTKD